VRDTRKLLSTLLLTLTLTLPAALAGPASAHSAGRSHRHGKARTSRGLHHGRNRQGGTRAPRVRTPKATRQRVTRTRETTPPASKKIDAAAQTAATLATVLATPCQNTQITPEAANIALAREAVLCLVNRERAEHSLAPLKANAQLEAAAEDHNAEMLEVDYFAHVAPDGETPVQRIQKTGYIASESDGYVIGENLAWGTYSLATPQAIVEAWIASPGHLANILEARYTETGIGITPAVPQSLGEGNPGATYAQEFGVLIH
jgi:uncharacterized protein YkwD